MASTFDYKSFAKNLTKQAESVIPDDIALKHKKEFLEKIYNYTYLAGEAFSNDETIEDSEIAKVLTQIISEWTFHKYIDLLRSDIPEVYHESILQKLAYVAFEMAKESAIGNLTQDEMLKLVEVQLNKAYEKSCKHLFENGQISKTAYENALNLSNINTMQEQLWHNVKVVKNRKSTFKYTLTAMLIGAITLIANLLYPDAPFMVVTNTAILVLLSAYIGFFIGVNKFSN